MGSILGSIRSIFIVSSMQKCKKSIVLRFPAFSMQLHLEIHLVLILKPGNAGNAGTLSISIIFLSFFIIELQVIGQYDTLRPVIVGEGIISRGVGKFFKIINWVGHNKLKQVDFHAKTIEKQEIWRFWSEKSQFGGGVIN